MPLHLVLTTEVISLYVADVKAFVKLHNHVLSSLPQYRVQCIITQVAILFFIPHIKKVRIKLTNDLPNGFASYIALHDRIGCPASSRTARRS